VADLELVRRLAAADRGLAVVAVARGDGSVQASLVNAGLIDDPTGDGPVVAFVARGGARKLTLLRRSGQASVVWRAGWEWVAVEGPARIVGPDDPRPEFDPGRLAGLLRDVFVGAGGTHGDWDEYDRVMAAERRAAVLVRPDRIVSNG
jgi:PPOX class probable F420-dependent enzyme